MFLFSMALKNALNNLYENTLYFITLIFCVISYYILCCFQYLDYSQLNLSLYEINDKFKYPSIALQIFIFIYILYCTLFFINKRKRELGLYSILGLKKSQISLILSFEIFIMGITTSVVALLIGTLFFKFFFMILIKLTTLKFINLNVFLVPKALINSIVLFVQIFLIMSIFCYIKLKRSSLLNMLNSYKQPKLTFKTSIFFSILSFCVLIVGFIFFFITIFRNHNYFPLSLFLFFIATYGLFSNIIFIFISTYKKIKFLYYRNLTMISLSDLLFKLKNNSKTFASIALLIATLLTASSGMIDFYNKNSYFSSNKYSYHCAYLYKNELFDKQFNDIVSKYPDAKIKKDLYINFIACKGIYPSILSTDLLDLDYSAQESHMNILSIDDFNNITDNFYSNLGNLNSTECFMFYGRDLNQLSVKYDIGSAQLSNSNIKFKVKRAFKNLFIKDSLFSFIVVSNDSFNALKNSYNYNKLRLIKFEDLSKTQNLTSDLTYHLNTTKFNRDIYSFNTLFSYFYSLISSSITIFIGFIIIFTLLICSANIIFFSQLSQINSDIYKYELIRNLGISKHEIYISIKNQVRVLFVLPSIVGIFYSFCCLILFKKTHLITHYNFIPSLSIFVFIYYIYYIYTVKSYYKLVVH